MRNTAKGYRLTRERLTDLSDRCITAWERNVEACINLFNGGSVDTLPKPAPVNERTVSEVINRIADFPGNEWMSGGLIADDRNRIAEYTRSRIRAMLANGGRGLRFVTEYAALVKKQSK